MKLYDVDGYDHPLRLSDEHAELIGATERELPSSRPKSNANKQTWVDYAIAQGLDADVASSMTRVALIEQYGGD